MEDNTVEKLYYSEMNIARGMLAVLVVLGHVVTQTEPVGRVMGDIFDAAGSVIYSFHMHAFFVISGFLSAKIIAFQTEIEKKAYIKSRFCRLMVPYFVMGAVYFFARIFSGDIARNEFRIRDGWKIFIGENPDGALWFLYVLFLFCVCTCICITKNNLYWVTGIAFALSLISGFYVLPIAVLNQFLLYAAYFLLGICIRRNYNRVRTCIKSTKMGGLCFLFFGISNLVLYVLQWKWIEIVTALSGTFLVLNLSLWFMSHMRHRKNRSGTFMFPGFLGSYSMDIYIFSEPVKVVVRTALRNTYILLNAACCWILGIVVPVLLSCYIVRRVKVFRILFLGME